MHATIIACVVALEGALDVKAEPLALQLGYPLHQSASLAVEAVAVAAVEVLLAAVERSLDHEGGEQRGHQQGHESRLARRHRAGRASPRSRL
jgi:hypothetical protein